MYFLIVSRNTNQLYRLKAALRSNFQMVDICSLRLQVLVLFLYITFTHRSAHHQCSLKATTIKCVVLIGMMMIWASPLAEWMVMCFSMTFNCTRKLKIEIMKKILHRKVLYSLAYAIFLGSCIMLLLLVRTDIYTKLTLNRS